MTCDNCERPLPYGCCHIFSHQEGCKLPARVDLPFVIGRAAVEELRGRRGLKSELDSYDYPLLEEIMEAVGNAVIRAALK